MGFRPGTAIGRHHSTEHVFIFFGDCSANRLKK